MQPLCFFCINKSGKPIPVYDVDKKRQVGTINNREAFIDDGGEDGHYISFLSPTGFIQANLGNDYDFENDQHASCLEYPYGEVTIDGKNYRTFIMRKTMNVYKGDESKWGAVAAGCLVATNSDKVGMDHHTWKLINYVQNTKGNWVKVDGAGYNHGFVDTGINVSSGYSKIAFYGSW